MSLAPQFRRKVAACEERTAGPASDQPVGPTNKAKAGRMGRAKG